MDTRKGKKIDDDQQWIHSIFIVDGDECQFNHIVPLGLSDEELQRFAETKENSYRLDILKDMYPGADYQSSPGETELERFEEWINDGCMNRDEEGQYTEKIEKKPWKGTHPPKTEPLDREKISVTTRKQHEDNLLLEAAAKANNNGQMIEVLFAHIRTLQDIVLGRNT